MENTYQIKTTLFQGPLELLLSLIETKKLHVNDISLAEVTEDYVRYVKGLEKFSISHIANFIIVAATLILIKSHSLLPGMTITPEEEVDINRLKERLTIYKFFRDISEKIGTALTGRVIWERPYKKNREVIFSPDKNFSLGNIHQAIEETLITIPKKETLPEVVVRKVISIEEMINSITERIKEGVQASFQSFSGKGTTPREKKTHTIVGFLALLELVKQGTILVTQHSAFHDITMQKNKTT